MMSDADLTKKSKVLLTIDNKTCDVMNAALVYRFW